MKTREATAHIVTATNNHKTNGHAAGEAAPPAVEHKEVASTRPIKPPPLTAADATAMLLAGLSPRYEKHLAEARALSPDQVREAPLVVAVIYSNLATGVDAVVARLAEPNAALLPPDYLPGWLEETRFLGQDFLAAATDAPSGNGKGIGVAPLIRDAAQARGVLLTSAQALVTTGHLPADEVKQVGSGAGPVKLASSCLGLVRLFGRHPEVMQHSAVRQEHLEAATRTGTALLAAVKARGSAPVAPLALPPGEGADLVDRMWTLVERAHDRLWRAGAVLFGRAVDEHVPPLVTRPKPKKKKTPPPAKAETPPAATQPAKVETPPAPAKESNGVAAPVVAIPDPGPGSEKAK